MLLWLAALAGGPVVVFVAIAQARANIERANESRAGYYIPNVVFRINGVDD